VRCHTVNTIHETQGEVPPTIVTGDQSDMSWLAEFGWYTYVWYMSPEDTSMERKKLGKYCGPFFNEGDAMPAKILTSKARQVNRTSVFRVMAEEARSKQFQKLAADFEASLKARLKKGYEPLEESEEFFDGSDEGAVHWEVSPTYDPHQDPGPQEPEETKKAMPELEFGAQFEGRLAMIVRAQHGLKGSGQAWRSHLAKVLLDDENLGFHMCKTDNDVWYRPATKSDGTKHCEHILVCTDDILCLSMNPKSILDYLDQRFLLKPESRGQPKTYLGADISPYSHQHEPDVYRWSMGSHTYVKEVVRKVETHLDGLGLPLKKKMSTVLPHEYKPELDVSKEYEEEEVSQCHQRIGVLRWAVELGRVDICTEVSMMPMHCAMLRKGHLDAIWHMIACLKRHDKSKMVFDSR